MADESPEKYLTGKSRSVLKSQERLMLMNVYGGLRLKYRETELLKSEICTEAADLCKVSERTFYRVKKEFNDNAGKVETPGKKRPNKKPLTRKELYGDFVYSAIRSKVHAMFRENKPPTINLIIGAVREDPELPNIGRSTMSRIMKELGFKHMKKKRLSIFIEREEIQLWRRRYLRRIRSARRQGKRIYYLDETWVNAGHTLSHEWRDTSVTSCKDAFLKGRTTGLKNPSGKGGRLVIGHVGSDEGFVEGGALVFEAKKSDGDYHDEMDGRRFEDWLRDCVIPNMAPNSVLVIDNAPYHSVQLEKVPNMSWKKADIQGWLRTKELTFDDGMVKAELICIVKENRPQPLYRVDEMLRLAGHEAIRLPPYHCELNPIEMVWSQVKRWVAANNATFKMDLVKNLVPRAFEQVTAEQWRNYIAHIIQEEDKMWNIDGIADHVVDRMVINVGDDSSSESEDDDEEKEDDDRDDEDDEELARPLPT